MLLCFSIHRSVRFRTMPARFRCMVHDCGEITPSLRDLCTHVRVKHSLSKNLQFPCPVVNCLLIIRTAENFRKHLTYKHAFELASHETHETQMQPPQNENYELGLERDVQQVEVEPNLVLSGDVYNSLMDDVRKESVRLRLHLEHNFTLSNVVARNVFSECVQFACDMQRKFSELYSTRLRELNVDDDDVNLFLQAPELERMCKDTTGSNLNALKELGYVEPEQINLYQLSGDERPLVSSSQKTIYALCVNQEDFAKLSFSRGCGVRYSHRVFC